MNFNNTPTHHESHISPELRAKAASKSTWVSVIVNLFLSIGQILIGIFSKSQGLIADGVHTLSDLVADFIVLFANRHSQKDPDEDHPYGHYRFENAASFLLGLILLIVGLGMFWNAIQKILNPESIAQVHSIALYMAIVALIFKELLFRYMLNVAKKVKSSMLVANAWHARSDAASSLVVAIGIAGNMMGYPILDPIAALIVGLMIIKMGLQFGWTSLNDLMDRAVNNEEIEAIRQTFLATEGVLGIHQLRTRKMGDMIIVDAHLEISGELNVRQGHDIAVNARNNVMEKHDVIDVITHLDPI
ncbi:cation diffusion facilitator family transporter [Acinetobacter gerneri]|jgi:cation diffusion facilitator family transporter|uniref:Cation diffusion facilitator family transporter n=1 Tax=Acinetobacter gerneri TaxID=202952 RepID=A0AAW8JG39_9GAMM|nr:cation diffusion facilitator family transporter [Acinetobacter gerneri]MCH4243324.1 cation diffusion facilitator family transporter [Acinetobacter gerneri]MDQ9008618.1 cation diffusion facilitator family transporter [Acinetobacter gerneri]MDQ9012834.1 cation diffusion facilitator family transporter [Acinetobacter gerneri]MDQ9024157.1 cation diffusion facilitator family transporter [Acinetobacter gerneri]MDQ9051394.1 cation diffusion facilitator family transporter [Acinetobacter gerneri]